MQWNYSFTKRGGKSQQLNSSSECGNGGNVRRQRPGGNNERELRHGTVVANSQKTSMYPASS